MSKAEKIELIDSIIQSVREKIVGEIIDNKIPDNWSGPELKTLLSDKFREACFVNMDNKAKREYHNTIMINNL